MHELALAQGILEIAQRYVPAERAGAARVVRVRVGKMVGVVVDSLVFCFEGIVRETPWERARLEVTVVPVVCACAACREEFSADEPVFACPECGSRGITRLSGDEFTVREIELDDEPAEVS